MEFTARDKEIVKNIVDDAEDLGLAQDERETLEKIHAWLEEIDALSA